MSDENKVQTRCLVCNYVTDKGKCRIIGCVGYVPYAVPSQGAKVEGHGPVAADSLVTLPSGRESSSKATNPEEHARACIYDGDKWFCVSGCPCLSQTAENLEPAPDVFGNPEHTIRVAQLKCHAGDCFPECCCPEHRTSTPPAAVHPSDVLAEVTKLLEQAFNGGNDCGCVRQSDIDKALAEDGRTDHLWIRCAHCLAGDALMVLREKARPERHK